MEDMVQVGLGVAALAVGVVAIESIAKKEGI